MRTNWSVVDDLVNTAKSHAALQFTLKYAMTAPLAVMALTVVAVIMSLLCCLCFSLQAALACLRRRRMIRNQKLIQLGTTQPDDTEEHEEVAHEVPRAAATSDSSDDDSPRKSREHL